MTAASRSLMPAVAGLGVSVTVGYAAISVVLDDSSKAMLPWVLGRGLGVAAYLLVTAVTILGLWVRHPWRVRWPVPAAETTHQLHAILSVAYLVALTGHVVSLAVDSFAGVGWTGSFVPGASGYRPIAVALGTIALYLGLATIASASLAGWVGRRVWLTTHRMAVAIFGLAATHGLLAGRDATGLREMYVVTIVVVVILALTRYLAPVPRSMVVQAQPRGGGS